MHQGRRWLGNKVQEDFANLPCARTYCVPSFVVEGVDILLDVQRNNRRLCVHFQLYPWAARGLTTCGLVMIYAGNSMLNLISRSVRNRTNIR